MYRYNHYIARHLIHAMLLITFSLTSIIWLTQALRFIDFIVNQGVSIWTFVMLTALLIPSLLFMIIPPAFFCAVLFVYNKLRIDSELVVLQAAGLSNWRLAKPALQAAALFTLVAYGISFYLQPASYRQFHDMQMFLRNNYASILLQDGVFNNPVDGLTVFIRDRDKDNILHGILVHDTRQNDKVITMMAEEGKLVETPQGPRFLLKTGNRQEMHDGKLSFLNFDSYTLDISFYAQNGGDHSADPRELYLSDLFTYDPSQSPAENQKRFAEGHQRLIWPAYTLVMALVGLAVLFSGEFNRRGHWHWLIAAIGLAVTLFFIAVALRGMMALKPHMVVMGYLNLVLPAAAAAWKLGDHMRRPARLMQAPA